MTGRPLVAILDYGIGNLHSAQKGFEHAGADARLTADLGLIRAAAGVVLPGVGAFAPCMAALGRTGLDEAAVDAVGSGRPFMGICVGMQVLFAGSDEASGVSGLGVFDRMVRWIPGPVKRPQMQWNVLDRSRDHPMLADLDDPIWVYFVHSLAPETPDGTDVVATCDYGGPVVAAVARDNVWAAQFHPEKSSRVGLRILANFVAAAAAAPAAIG
ncbi:MAG: imidazole glycerol phosphate synthase subunit HisH [Acidimicrobiaceae bacterium]|nr:imidazole glycerol phosphate synthase subunit HisH [Acidimicrobiaceae bacterium]